MNKTKKYTLIFIALCFIFIGGAGIYHTCFPNQEEKEVIEIKEESEVHKQITDFQQETTQQNESSKTKQEKQSVEKEEKKTQQKTESQDITNSKKDISKKEESESKQPVQETSEEIERETDESEEVVSVNVTITGIDGVMAQDYIEYEEGMSAYDALKILAENYEMDVKTSGLGQAVYVKGVNGLMEFDYGGQSGWKYKVNGAYPSLSAGAYILKADDQVEWFYTTNG